MRKLKRIGIVGGIISAAALSLQPGTAYASYCSQAGITWGSSASCGSGKIWGNSIWELWCNPQTHACYVTNQILEVELRGQGTYARAQGTWDDGSIVSECVVEDTTNNFLKVRNTTGCQHWMPSKFNVGGQFY